MAMDGVSRQEGFKSGQCAVARFGIAQQAAMVMGDQHDAHHLEGKLLRVGRASQMACFGRQVDCPRDDREAAALHADDCAADGAGPVVVFVGRRNQDAIVRPSSPRRLAIAKASSRMAARVSAPLVTDRRAAFMGHE
jgi:hypothetical protein